MNALNQEFYTLDEVSKTLRLSRRQVGRIIADGKLKTYQFGSTRAKRVRREDLEAFVDRCSQ